MTFFQTFAVAFFGLFLSLSTSWAVCPVLAIDGSKFELYEDATSYADQLAELKQVLVELGEDVDLSDIPTNDDNLSFINGDCEDLVLFRKTIWYNNGDLRFVDFAKRIIKVEEAKMRLFLDANKIKKAMDAADEVIEIEELFAIKGSFAGLFFFFLISFLLRKIQGAHKQEKYLRSATMNFFPRYVRCKEVRLDMVSDQVKMKKEANGLFILKGKLVVYCILITLLGSLICNEASAAPKLSVWEGRTTSGACYDAKKAIAKAIAENAEKPSAEAGQMFINQAVNKYSACLKKAFRKALLKKIKGLSNEALVLSNGLKVDKKALLKESFVDKLISTGYYLDNPSLKDAVLMTKAYFNRSAIEKAKAKIEMAKTFSR